MKKKIFFTIMFVGLMLIVGFLLGNLLNKDKEVDTNMKKVTVAEPTLT